MSQKPWFPNQPADHRVRKAVIGLVAAVGMLIAGCAVLVAAVLNQIGSASRPPTQADGPPALGIPDDPAPVTPAPKTPKPVVYQAVTAKELSSIGRDPERYQGRRIVVYGLVTRQLDESGSRVKLRVEVGGVRERPDDGEVDYPTRAILTGDPARLGSLERGDLFVANVTVGGESSNDPLLLAGSVKPDGAID